MSAPKCPPPSAPLQQSPGTEPVAASAPLPDVRCALVPDLNQVAEAEWDRLLDVDDRPLLQWAYLQALEAAGCVGPPTSWHPAHLLVRHARTAELLAAAPAYVKADSDGEWVYD